MPEYIDLSLPIRPHFRWPMERGLASDYDKGAQFQTTWIKLVVHGFTHIDSPRHMVRDGKTSSEVPLEATIGEAAIIDISDVAPIEEITAEQLAERGGHVRPGDIVLIKMRWDEKHSLDTPEFWTESPYLSRGACEWLLSTGLKAMSPDFPQDYPIRGLLKGEVAPIEDFVSHDVLLRNGVILIEYVGSRRPHGRSHLHQCPAAAPSRIGRQPPG